MNPIHVLSNTNILLTIVPLNANKTFYTLAMCELEKPGPTAAKYMS